MSKIDPILNFRILPEVFDHEEENFSFVNEGHTMITKTREAADSSEHSEPEANEVVDENFQITSRMTMITETREAVDSSEHA